MTRLTVGANSTALGGNGVLLLASGNANVTTTVSESDFTSSREDLFQHVVQGQAKSNFTFTDNELSNNHPAKLTGSSGILVQSGGNENAELTYRIANNKVREITGPAIFVQKAVGISKAPGADRQQPGRPRRRRRLRRHRRHRGRGARPGQPHHRDHRQRPAPLLPGRDRSDRRRGRHADNGTVSFDVNVTTTRSPNPKGRKSAPASAARSPTRSAK